MWIEKEEIKILGQTIAKVMDFGIAKVMEGVSEAVEYKATTSGKLYCTPDYCSPEQAQGEKLDGRSDG